MFSSCLSGQTQKFYVHPSSLQLTPNGALFIFQIKKLLGAIIEKTAIIFIPHSKEYFLNWNLQFSLSIINVTWHKIGNKHVKYISQSFSFKVLAAKLHTILINTGTQVRLGYSFSTGIFTSLLDLQKETANLKWMRLPNISKERPVLLKHAVSQYLLTLLRCIHCI